MNPFHCKLKVLFFFYGSVASHKVYVHFLSAIVRQGLLGWFYILPIVNWVVISIKLQLCHSCLLLPRHLPLPTSCRVSPMFNPVTDDIRSYNNNVIASRMDFCTRHKFGMLFHISEHTGTIFPALIVTLLFSRNCF